MKRKRCVPGFTLIELLVVIGIILVLASMVMVVLLRVTSGSKQREAEQVLRDLALGINAMKEFYDYDGVWGKNGDGSPLTFNFTDSGGTVTAHNLKDTPWEEFTKALNPTCPDWSDEFDRSAGGTPPHLNWKNHDYYQFTTRQIKNNRPVDPWKHTYRYRVFYETVSEGSGDINYEVEVIYSLGPDGMGDPLGPEGLENPDNTGDDDAHRQDDIVIMVGRYRTDDDLTNVPWTAMPTGWKLR